MEIIKGMILLIMLITFSITDILHRNISVKMVVVFGVIGVVLNIIEGTCFSIETILGIFVGGVIGGIAVIFKNSIGVGDGVVTGLIGLYSGVENAMNVLLVAIVISGVVSLVLLILKVVTAKYKLPFVVSLLLGYIGVLL